MRDVKYRQVVEVICDVAHGDDVAALDEARDAVRVEAASRANLKHDAVSVRWEVTDDGVRFAAIITENVGAHPPVTHRPGVRRTEPGDPVSIHDGVDAADRPAGCATRAAKGSGARPGDTQRDYMACGPDGAGETAIAGTLDMTGGGLTEGPV